MARLAVCSLLALAALAQGSSVLDCLAVGPDGCLVAELNRALSNAEQVPVIRITRDLAILASPRKYEPMEASGSPEEQSLDRLERYLHSHSLRLELPEELLEGARALLPASYLAALPRTLAVPLAQEDSPATGRGFMRKVVVPFLLGLKFKLTAVIPLAMAFIALKTWKALTLGLLSVVLSAALVIFRLTRPKVLNYEVVVPPHHHHIVDEHYQARAADLAYRGYR